MSSPMVLLARGKRPPAAVEDWPSAGTADGAHYSRLAEISAGNVHELRLAWVYRTGDVARAGGDTSATSFQATPIMVDGTLYFSTPFNRVIALDAETGAERWTFDPRIDRSAHHRRDDRRTPHCAGCANRGQVPELRRPGGGRSARGCPKR
ncbi:MAG: hypothetical protein ACT4PJ_14480 [Gemmatimonadaceae bacterium]